MRKLTALLFLGCALFAGNSIQAAPAAPQPQNPTAPSYDSTDSQGWSRATNAVNSNPDNSIAKSIYEKIKNDRDLSEDTKRLVQVTVYNGNVTLEGPVKNSKEKTRIEFLVKQIQGVHDISNKLNTASK